MSFRGSCLLVCACACSGAVAGAQRDGSRTPDAAVSDGGRGGVDGVCLADGVPCGACRTCRDGACVVDVGAPCGASSCDGTTFTPAPACDPSGACVPSATSSCPADAPYCEAGACSPCVTPRTVTIDRGAQPIALARDPSGTLHALYTRGELRESVYARCAGDCLNAASWSSVVLPAAGATSMAVDDGGGVHVIAQAAPASGITYAECTAGCDDPANWTGASLPLAWTPAFVAATDRGLWIVGQGSLADCDSWANAWVVNAFCAGGCTDAASWSMPSYVTEAGSGEDLHLDFAGAGDDGSLIVGVATWDTDMYGDCDARADVRACPPGAPCHEPAATACAWPDGWEVHRYGSDGAVVGAAIDSSSVLRVVGQSHHGVDLDGVQLTASPSSSLWEHDSATVPLVSADGVALAFLQDGVLSRASCRGSLCGTADLIAEPIDTQVTALSRSAEVDADGVHVLYGAGSSLRYARVPNGRLCGCGTRIGGPIGIYDTDNDLTPGAIAVDADGVAHLFVDGAGGFIGNCGAGGCTTVSPDPDLDPYIPASGVIDIRPEGVDALAGDYFSCDRECWAAESNWTEVASVGGTDMARTDEGLFVAAAGPAGSTLWHCAGDCADASAWTGSPLDAASWIALAANGTALHAIEVTSPSGYPRTMSLIHRGCAAGCDSPGNWTSTTIDPRWLSTCVATLHEPCVPHVVAEPDGRVDVAGGTRFLTCPGACDDPTAWTSVTLPVPADHLLRTSDGLLVALAASGAFAACRASCDAPDSWKVGVLRVPIGSVVADAEGLLRVAYVDRSPCDYDWAQYATAEITCTP